MNHFSSNINKLPIFFLFFYWNFNSFAPCELLGRSQYRPTFGQQYQNGNNKHASATTFFKEYSASFLMVCRLRDFALVVPKLLMFKVCVIIGISKIEFLNFSGTERIKQNKKKLNTFGLFSKFFFQMLIK